MIISIMSNILPIAFDLDGTLIDSAPDIHACVNKTLADHGQPGLSLDQVRGFIGHGVAHLWVQVRSVTPGLADLPLDTVIARFTEYYSSATVETRVFPHVYEALELLASRGYPLALCTNKPMAATESVLTHFKLRAFFGTVIAGDSLTVRKPDPAPLYAAMAGRSGVFIGDSEVDAATAQAAAVPFLLFTKGYRKTPVNEIPHLKAFSDFSCLPDLIASL